MAKNSKFIENGNKFQIYRKWWKIPKFIEKEQKNPNSCKMAKNSKFIENAKKFKNS